MFPCCSSPRLWKAIEVAVRGQVKIHPYKCQSLKSQVLYFTFVCISINCFAVSDLVLLKPPGDLVVVVNVCVDRG